MGMLTTSSVYDAKQNSIKLTQTAELTPTQSVQEIDFFNNKCSTDFPEMFAV